MFDHPESTNSRPAPFAESTPELAKEEDAVILRVFKVRIREGRAAEFKRMVQEQSIPWLERSDGMLGYIPGAPMDESSREFVMVTLWRDVDALKAFAGEQWQTPVVTDDEAPLVEEMFADHYVRFEKAPAA